MNQQFTQPEVEKAPLYRHQSRLAAAILERQAANPSEKLPPVVVPEGRQPARLSNGYKQLVVSIHDVSPLTWEAADRIVKELAELGVSHVALLVIPDYHGAAHFLDHPEFSHWLRDRAGEGHEVVLHGYKHWRPPSIVGFKKKLATRPGDDAEFMSVTGALAIRLVSQAQQELRILSLNPRGFVAPAWQLGNDAERALQALKFGYTATRDSLWDYTTGMRHRSKVLEWNQRGWWRRLMRRFRNRWMYIRQRSRPLMRMAIHPGDIRYRGTWKQIKRLTGKALRRRIPTTYESYLKLD